MMIPTSFQTFTLNGTVDYVGARILKLSEYGFECKAISTTCSPTTDEKTGMNFWNTTLYAICQRPSEFDKTFPSMPDDWQAGL